MLVIFDLDETLVDRSAAVRDWGRALLSRFGASESQLELIVEADADGRQSRVKFIEILSEALDPKVPRHDLADFFRREYISFFRATAGAHEGLTSLRAAGYCIAVVSNGPASRQSKKLEASGLTQFVDVLCTADEVGVSKPGSAIFREAARKCGSSMDGWVVGDDPEGDVLGGIRVGLRTVWLDRGKAWRFDGHHPEYSTSDLKDAVNYILSHT